jgi:Origin recognition complex subunit 2
MVVSNEDTDEQGRSIEHLGPSANEFEGLQFGTRATNKSRKRLGKGKKSSLTDSKLPQPNDAKKTKAEHVTNVDLNSTVVGTMAILQGIEKCFVGARRGAKGIRGALDRSKARISLAATGAEMDYFETTLTQFDPMDRDREVLIQQHLSDNALSWLWRMQIDYNILLFGVGCKRALVRTFAAEFLAGQHILMIDGDSEFSSNSNRVIKELLDGICSKILKRQDLWSTCLELESYVRLICDCLDVHYCRELRRKKTIRNKVKLEEVISRPPELTDADEDTDNDCIPGFIDGSKNFGINGGISSNFLVQKRPIMLAGTRNDGTSGSRAADPKWGGRYSHAQSKLYIIVNNIDGESLQSDESQTCLALLAACSSVSIIANAESLNAPVMWSPQTLSMYRWANYHVPTYLSYAFDATEVNSLGGGSKEFPGGTKALEYIFKSLTKRHEELVSMLAKDAIKQYDTIKVGSSSSTADSNTLNTYRGINIEELLIETSRSVVARSMPELNTLLQELIDHKIVSKVYDSQRKLFVWITLPPHTLRKLAVTF